MKKIITILVWVMLLSLPLAHEAHAQDTDGDGIANAQDLDDDNDGILDVNEAFAGPVVNGDFSNGGTNWTAADIDFSGNDAFFSSNDDDAGLDGSLSQTLNNLSARPCQGGLTLSLDLTGIPTTNSAHHNIDIYLGGTRYATIAVAGTNTPQTNQVTVFSGATSNITTYSSNVVTPISINIPYNGPSTATLEFRYVNCWSCGGLINRSDSRIDNIRISANNDCDADGIPNDLDLDSDNDGCPDVIEGGANFVQGASYITGNRLNTTVNANGVPAVPAGTSGYTVAAGQTVGGSVVAAQLTVNTPPANQTVSPPAAASFSIATTASNGTSYSGTAPNTTPVYGTPGNGNAQRVYQWYLGNPDAGGTLLTNTGVYSGVTTATLNISNSTGLTGNQYFVVAGTTNNECIREVRSATLLLACSVSAASSTPTVCVNTAITNITHTTASATGIGAPTGLPTGVTASFASNTITISGTPSVLGIFNYSIPVTGGTCSGQTATGTITVNGITSAGTIAASQTICSGTTPAAFTSSAVATGTGSITYQWQSSINSGSSWSNISGATNATYAAGALTQTTQFRRLAFGGGCPPTGTPSNVVTVTVPTLDSDGDGIANFCDLDDDNDGILDVNETGGYQPSVTAGMAITDNGTTRTLTGGSVGSAGLSLSATRVNGATYSTAVFSQTTQYTNAIAFGVDPFPSSSANSFSQATTLNNSSTARIDYTITFSVPMQRVRFYIYNIDFHQIQFVGTNHSETLIDGSPELELTAGRILRDIVPTTHSDPNRDGYGIVEISPANGGNFTSITFRLIDNPSSSITGDGWVFAMKGLIDVDTDGDGIPNRLDLDSDNDGIPDNVEAMTTLAYVAPTGGVGTNGYYDVYETAADNGIPIAALATLANTDGLDQPDYLDTDSDNDGLTDAIESGLGVLSGNVGSNGLDNSSNFETADNFADVNGVAYGGGVFALVDSDKDINANGSGANPMGQDFDYRDNSNDACNPAVSNNPDTDGDGITDFCDLDDDNDGILDVNETGGYKRSVTSGMAITDNGTTRTLTGGTVGSAGLSLSATRVNGATYSTAVVPATDQYTNAIAYGVDPFPIFGPNSFDQNTNLNNSSTARIDYTITFSVPMQKVRFYISGTDHHQIQFVGTNHSETLIDGGSELELTTSRILRDIAPSTVGDPSRDGFGIVEISPANGGNFTSITFRLIDNPSSNVTNEAWRFAIKGSIDGDNDADGIFNRLDLDSDNDGIPDNVEAMTTLAYVAPTGGVGTNGYYDVYETAADNGIPIAALATLANTDAVDQPDFLDTDSDNDGLTDATESGLGVLSGNVGSNGLDNSSNFETADNFADVNGVAYGGGVFALVDSDNDINANGSGANPMGQDFDYRDNSNDSCDPAISNKPDTDGDGVADFCDLDDDNDGILDVDEEIYVEFITNGSFNNSGAGWSVSVPPIDFSGGDAFHSSDDDDAAVDGEITQNLTGLSNNDGNLILSFDITGFQNGSNHHDFSIRIHNKTFVNISVAGTVSGSNAVVVSNGASTSTASIVSGVTSTIEVTIPYSAIGVDNALLVLRWVNCWQCGYPGRTDSRVDNVSLSAKYGDNDADGILNRLDLDSDNDGIPDNVEAMTTLAYVAPTGGVGTNGYYDVYETAADNGITIAALATLANTDGLDQPDYLDTDSDNDGVLDVNENYAPRIASAIANVGSNGLDDNAETAGTDQGYTDVNGIAHDGTVFTNLFDADGDALTGGDFEYRENCSTNPVTCVTCDAFAVRDRFSLNCKEYTVVNRAMLDSMVTNGGDFSAVCVSKVTNMSYLFAWNTSFNQDISAWGWDVSNVTNMEGMFINAQSYNQPFGPCWDVSSVTNMSKMFSGAFAFNQDISNWEVGNVTNMSEMFFLAKAFNQNIGSWDVSSVTNMKATFAGMSFNQNIGGTTGWDVSSVTTMDSMFYGNPAFNQNLNDWNVSSVSNMGAMFQYATAFNQDITGWTTTSLTDMNAMFFGARAFNQDISGWDVSQVTNMQSTFQDARAFNQNIGIWNVGNVTNMQAMFAYTPIFNQDIGNWDVSSVTNMSGMFNRATVFNQDLGGWDVSSVTNMTNMFWVAAAFNQNLSSWCVTQIASEPARFAVNSPLDPTTLNKPLWGTCPPACLPNTLGAAFNAAGCLECDSYNVGDRFVLNGNCYTVVDRAMLDAMVANGGDFSKVCVSKVTDMSGLFDRQVAFNQNISTWDVSNVTNMSTMFRWGRSFNQDISNWDVSSVSNMSAMFQNAWGFNQDISGWDVSSLNSAAIMFQNAFAFNQDISGWNVSNVSSMMHMFKNATSFNQDISTWDVANVSNMTRMFEGATVFNQDLSPWCVGLIPSLPINFATNSPLATLTVQHPIWGQVPQMNVQGGSPLTDITAGSAAVSLANGTDLGTASSAVQTFTLENNGTRDLVLEAGAITLTGTHAADFTVGGITLPATIAAGTSSTFTVSYSALGTGLRTATVNIASNDCENSVYDFAVEATAPTSPGTVNTGNGSSSLPTALEWYAYNQNDALYLRLPATTDVQHKVEIYSTNGQRVASFSTDEDEVQILQDAPSGMYLIYLGGETQRVVK